MAVIIDFNQLFEMSKKRLTLRCFFKSFPLRASHRNKCTSSPATKGGGSY